MSFEKLKPFVQAAVRFADEQLNRLFQGGLLRITCLAGLMLSVLIGGALAVFGLIGGNNPAAAGEEAGFYRLLRDYDRAEIRAGALTAAAGRESEKLNRELDRLEKKAESVESWLSVLKRRRRLALLDPRQAGAYRQSARDAARAYPWSEPLAAVAAAALIQNTAVSGEAETELRSYLPLLSGAGFASLRLSLHVLAGDLKNPGRAANLSGLSAIKARDLSLAEREAAASGLAMAKLFNGDSAGAAVEIQGLLSAYLPGGENGAFLSDTFLGFAAEYCYDFGALARAAEIFSHIPGEQALLRQADALWLGGYRDSARTVWALAGAPRGLYNLAITTPDGEEAAALLERLIRSSPDGLPGQYGLIRYSRLLPAPEAITVLESAAVAGSPAYPLVDLEKLRRRRETGESPRLAAETWLLLDRHPGAEDLYRWAAWYFDFQRNFGETAILLRNAGQRRFSGQWTALHQGLGLCREGDLDNAAGILLAVPDPEWPVTANLGRIFEAFRAPERALEYYKTAAALVQNRTSAARIQFRAAQCLKTLGRGAERKRALEYALELDPGSLNARLELDRASGD